MAADESQETIDTRDIDATLADASLHAKVEAAGALADEALAQPLDELEAAMAAAAEGEDGAAGLHAPRGVRTMDVPSLEAEEATLATAGQSIDLLRDVQLDVKIELGRSRMLVDDVLRLGEGSVVELDKLAGDPVDVYVNDRLVARGEVLVLNDNFCVRISDIVQQDLEAVAE